MSTTWPAFRDNIVRVLISDVAKKKVTDDNLLAFANIALNTLTRDAPRRAYFDLTGNGSSFAFTMPSATYKLLLVEDTQEREYLSEVKVQPGTKSPDATRSTTSRPRGYMPNFPQEGTLSFAHIPSDGSVIRVHYNAYHIAMYATGSRPFESGWKEEALAAYTSYLAFSAMASARAQNEQWDQRSALPVDNPLEQQARFFLEQYRRVVTA